ncbi:MAG: hypothetical protein M3Y69_06035 [Verrucomicrobiota bacterium]|nr:hypothetical protein [Verrucomicrobiota bacterium]
MEQELAKQSPHDFFLDLRDGRKDWATAGTSRLENNGRMPTALSADFDGAILLHHVSSAELEFLPSWLRIPSPRGFRVHAAGLYGARLASMVAHLIFAPSPWLAFFEPRRRLQYAHDVV